MNQITFQDIQWPDEFVVVFKDGQEQIFTSSQGVYFDNGSNLSDENENRANITASWQKKSPSQNKFRGIVFFVDEVASIICSKSNDIIWNNLK